MVIANSTIGLAGGVKGGALGSGWPHVLGGVAAFLLREHQRRREVAARRMASAVRAALAGGLLALSCTTAVISLTFAVFAPDILRLAFGPEFVGEAPAARIIAASFLVRALDVGPYVGCRTLRRPDQNVAGNIVFIVLGAGLALALMPSWVVLGASVALLIASIVIVALNWWNFLRLTTQGMPLRAGSGAIPPLSAGNGRR